MIPLAVLSPAGLPLRPLAYAVHGRVYTEGLDGLFHKYMPKARPLYVSRRVTNADEVIAWAKSVGFETCLPPKDMHVTVCFSRKPVDWGAAGLPPLGSLASMHVPNTGRRALTTFDDKAVVLTFDSAGLRARWQQFLDAGATWDHDDYRPHITISYNKPEGLALDAVVPFAGTIELGPEIFEPVEENWKDGVKEHALLATSRTKDRLDTLEAHALPRLRDALEESRDALLARVRNAKDPERLVKDLELPRRPLVLMEVRAMLERAWEAGQRDARAEVRQGKREYAEWDESKHPRHPAGAPDSQGGEFAPAISDAERHALIEYGRDLAEEVNYDLRKGGLPGPQVRLIDDVMRRSVSTKPMTLYRVGGDLLFGPVGSSVVDPAFVSTSSSLDYLKTSTHHGGRQRAILSISSGVGALDMARLRATTRPYEHEVLLQRGLEFRVTKRDGGFVYVDVGLPTKVHTYASSFIPKLALKWLRSSAFYITNLIGTKITNDAKAIILNGLKTGKPTSVMMEELLGVFLPYLGNPGVVRDTKQLEPYRLETIVRTNTTAAYNHGRLTQFMDKDILPFLKGVRYSAILDERTTEVCTYLHGKVFKPSSPDLEALLPPNHFNCRSVVVPIVAGEKIDVDEFITPSEVGRARELADAKFLSEKEDVREYDTPEVGEGQ